MKIIICGSISAAEEILEIRNKLVSLGHDVEIPEGVKRIELRQRVGVSDAEHAADKIKYDLIRGYYEKMKLYDAVLVVNIEKKGIPGYIGGNTFIEMAFAHVLNKKLYCLNPLPDAAYISELMAMQPIILNGDIDRIS
jgi:hypothetical protein